jgi:transketolase
MKTSSDLANAIRFLSIDAVQKASSGHPGMPMGMADIAEVLWHNFLKHNPANPSWLNRDRFVLSNGHGSMLLYSLLHLTGYDLTIEDLQQFRQLNSKTPGHPEYGCTAGVETTTGPLGQGLANAVGMALAEKSLATQFNRHNYDIIDHYTYVFLGDGCLMEGISHEACSLAGTLGLGKLIAFYDNNGISIDGKVSGWFTDVTRERFEAYGWHIIDNVDGHDTDAIHKAIVEARFTIERPSLICCCTSIAFGAPNLCNTCKAHGAPLGEEEIAASREKLGWKHEPFVIPEDIYFEWNARLRGKMLEKNWQKLFSAYQKDFPELAAELNRRTDKIFPNNWEAVTSDFINNLHGKLEAIATRKASQNCLQVFCPLLPEMLGGSADLTESNLTNWIGAKTLSHQDFAGNYLHYGVREFGMFAIMSGIALHGGFIPFGGTFLIFSDYGRNAIRLAALMRQRVIYVLSHDSIGLGEDGPTHQPIEQLASLRMIPDLVLWRPCDQVETADAWKFALERSGPTCLVLTRQKTQQQSRANEITKNIFRGGYILVDSIGTPDVIIIATGSEVEIAVAVAEKLNSQNKKLRVVSMPSTNLFDQQDDAYKEEVLPKNIRTRLAIEAGKTDFWYKYVGLDGKVIGIDEFGKSAPAEQLFEKFGITVGSVLEAIKNMLRF